MDRNADRALKVGAAPVPALRQVNTPSIALHLGGEIGFKHRLKSVDRLLGNGALHQMRAVLYRRFAQYWLKDVKQWLVVVDWSDLTSDQRWLLLRTGASAVQARQPQGASRVFAAPQGHGAGRL